MSKYSFDNVKTLNYRRSRFQMPHNLTTSFNVGQLVPLDLMEVLPGDTIKQKTNIVCRFQSPFIKVPMANLFLDYYSFFVPGRLLYSQYEKVFGDPNPSSWTSNTLVSIPVTSSKQTVHKHSVADYLGLPVGDIPKGVSILPFRAFAKIYNDWFRNENIISETYLQSGSSTLNETFNNLKWSPTNYTGLLPKVSKIKDYFTSCLPGVQKGIAPGVPVNAIPVYTGVMHGINPDHNGVPTSMTFTSNNSFTLGQGAIPAIGNFTQPMGGSNGNLQMVGEHKDSYDNDITFEPTNLWTAASSSLFNVNELRFAMQLQLMLAKDARFGTRYHEYLLGHYGVNNGDARLQRSEYLGGSRLPLTFTQVASTASTSDAAIAQVSSMVLAGTSGTGRFNKSFTEHGYIITVGCVRQVHTYAQGIAKLWFRKERNDFYDPLFAHLAEQPVYKSQVYGLTNSSTATLKDEILGYNECWAEYRYLPNRITGDMRPGANTLGNYWTMADNMVNAPTLNAEFIEEEDTYVKRCLADNVNDQIILDALFDTTATRVMPVHGNPGYMDHMF